MYTTECKIRVRYGETDKMGYVYYGNYALYYEEARTDAIRQLGITYKDLEEAGIMMPVMNVNIHYLRPAFYDDLLRIETVIDSLGTEDTEIIFKCTVYNEAGKVLNKAEIKLAYVSAETRRKVPIPDILYQKLAPFFNT